MIKKINFFKKIKYFTQNPTAVLLFGKNFNLIEKIILDINKDIKVIDGMSLKKKDLIFIFKTLSSPILIFKNLNDLPNYKIKEIINNFPQSGTILFKQEKKINKKLKSKLSPTKLYSFSLNKKADITLEKFHKNHGTNFKINYKGNSVPFWVKQKLNKDNALNILAGISVGIILKNNLVEISQILKEKY